MPFYFKTYIENWLLDEQSRWLLWVPVAIGCGVILYFMQHNLPEYTGIAMFCAGAPALVFWRNMPWARGLLLAIFFAGAGFIAAQFQQYRFEQPILKYPTSVLPITATLQEVIEDEGKQKLVLERIEVEGGTRYPLPNTIRLSLKKPDKRLIAGQRIKLRGGLFPLPKPALPEGFDFTRHFYFKNIGAVGFALRPVEILQDKAQQSWRINLANFRSKVGEHIDYAMRPYFSDAVIAVSTALITGERSGIPEASKEAMRAAGLAHMLAISGLHLGLVTAVFFVLFRYILLLIPGLALRQPIKKWAAMGSLIAGVGYLTLAGFPVSAQRAYVMVALVLMAIILDRQVMPMRSLALAAIVILLIAPASIMGPSFQLSFSATMGIVALYEFWRRWNSKGDIKTRGYGFSQKIMLYISGILATTFVASIMTAPYAVYHFNQFTNYHLLANMAASPIFSFMVMPAAVGGVLMMPLGFEQPFLWLMGQGVEWIIAIATSISAMPNAMLHVPTPPAWGLALVAIGSCWLCFWQRPVRHIGWLIIIAGLVPFFTVSLPDILISEKAEQVAIKLENGEYAMLRGSKKNFKAGLWLDALGIERFAKVDKLGNAYKCDKTGCLLDYKGKHIALPKWREVAIEDCAEANIMISSFYTECNNAITIERPKQAVSITIDNEIKVRKASSFLSRLSARD